MATALLDFLEHYHDQHYGKTAAEARRREEAERERDWLEDPDRGVGGSWAPGAFGEDEPSPDRKRKPT